MTHPFSFGFGSDDIEEVGDETVEVGASHDTQKDISVAATEPKLHKLQDLVRNTLLSALHPLPLDSPLFLPLGINKTPSMALMYSTTVPWAAQLPLLCSRGRA